MIPSKQLIYVALSVAWTFSGVIFEQACAEPAGVENSNEAMLSVEYRSALVKRL